MELYTKVELINIEKLYPYHNNPKTHPPEQIDRLCSSIKNYGFTVPLIIDGENEIIAGHGRYEAAKKLGLEELPCIQRDDLTPEQIKAFRIADNKVAESEWDMEMLEVEFEAIEDEFTGFDLEELDFMEEELEVEEDDFDEEIDEDKPTITELGDLIELGRHRLVCGDSTSEEDVSKLMDGNKADMAFTDPPYNINYQDLNKDFDKIENDKMAEDNFRNFLSKSLKFIPKKSYVCCNWQTYNIFYEELKNLNKPVKSCIVWDKVTRRQNLDKYFKQHEFILYTGKLGGEETLRGDIWKVNREISDKHPTMKPVELVGMALKDNPKELNVLDLFGGSGSTLIAAEQLNRNCYMMELDEHYCDVIIRRYINYKQDKGENINIKLNGESIDYSRYIE